MKWSFIGILDLERPVRRLISHIESEAGNFAPARNGFLPSRIKT
jgi:hypothetical protein